MSWPLLVGAYAGALVASAWASVGLVGWLERHAMLDVPNARSMHRRPLPRGGGIAFVGITLSMHALLLASGALPPDSLWWWVTAAFFAALGWSDDCRPLRAGLRLFLQIVAAIAFVAMQPATPAVDGAALGALSAAPLVVFVVVWSVNLYNFMDGADGYAATQAVFMALAASALFVHADSPGAALLAATLAGACSGFLGSNRPPARLFMGDVGSYFLGFEFAALGLYGVGIGISMWIWLILGAPFVVDASLTLLRRLWRGERWWLAHRQHAYQGLLLRGWPAARLLLALALVNVLVCWPCAALARSGVLPSGMVALAVYLLAAIMWFIAIRARARA